MLLPPDHRSFVRNDSCTVAGNEVTFHSDEMSSPCCIAGDTLYLLRVDADNGEPLVR